MENSPNNSERSRINQSEWLFSGYEANAYVEEATNEVASVVRTTFGPRGMEKLIHTTDSKDDPHVVITKDAGEIIDTLQRGSGFNHPVAALFIDSVDSVRRSLHDGTTTSILLTAELISQGLTLLEQDIHPTNVMLGYSIAVNQAGQTLDKLVRQIDENNDKVLFNIAETTFPADLSPVRRKSYSRMAVEAVQRIDETEAGWLDTDDIKIMSKIGEERRMYNGVIVQRRPQGGEKVHEDDFDWAPIVPSTIYDSTVALIDREITLNERAISFSQGEEICRGRIFRSTNSLETYRIGEQERLGEFVEKLQSLEIDVLVSQKIIDEEYASVFEDAGIVVVDAVNLPERDIDRLATATGGTIVARIGDLTRDDLGTIGRLDESRVGDEKWATFDECRGSAVTIIVDAHTESEASRHERLIEDAIEVVAMAIMDGQAIPGAGAPAMAIAADLREYAQSIPSREQLAIQAFANALEKLVLVLSLNMGSDRTAVLSLRNAHRDTNSVSSMGLGLDETPIDAWETGVIEPRRVFSQAIETARSTAEQLLTVDAILYPNVDLETHEPMVEHE